MQIDIAEFFETMTTDPAGKEFWVCRLAYDKYDYTAYDNTKPILATIRWNIDAHIPPSTVNSHFHFAIKTKDGFSRKRIHIYINGGYVINVFDNEAECVEFYNQIVKEYKQGFNKYLNGLRDNSNRMLSGKDWSCIRHFSY